MKSIIDKLVSISYKVKNYPGQSETHTVFLQTSLVVDKLVSKYSKLVRDFHMGEENAFNDWNYLRNSFTDHPINWMETNIRPTENMFINSDLINYYDVSSNIMLYYLVSELVTILDGNPERISKINIAQLYIETIAYLYQLYNMDRYKNSLDLKRFEYILEGSPMMVDILKKGQGLLASKTLEEGLAEIEASMVDMEQLTEEEKEEIEDLKEEAESLDVGGRLGRTGGYCGGDGRSRMDHHPYI